MTPELDVLRTIEQRVLWLATRIIDVPNRRNGGEVKVGDHQASCASIMTALWFRHIGGHDKVAVKPHASPVSHAIKYLTGELDRSYLTTLRQRGGLQAYPSRTKDPDVSDFSTGSVGLGAVAPLFSALTRRYVDAHFDGAAPDARFIALVGDAELDEGNIWEAIAGTPSGVTLASEGGAHQSTITASVGAELPNLNYAEPAYATEVDWLLCDALDQLSRPEGTSSYLRLSTRPIDQEPFAAALERHGEQGLRAQVLAGGYRLVEGTVEGTNDDRPAVTLVTTGAMAPEAIAADRARPIISAHDAASHSLAWTGSALGTRQFALGVDQFGESGNIVNAALIAISE